MSLSTPLIAGDFFVLDDTTAQISYTNKALTVVERPVSEALERVNKIGAGATVKYKGTTILINKTNGYYVDFTVMCKQYGHSLKDSFFAKKRMEVTHFIEEFQDNILERF